MVDQAAPGLHLHTRERRQGHHGAVGTAQQQRANRLWRRTGAGYTHGHRNGAVGLRELADDGALVSRIDRLQNVTWLQSVQRQPLRPQLHIQLGLARRDLQAHFAGVRQLLQHRGDPGRHRIIGIQVVAEYTDEERRSLAGQGLADTLGEHRINLSQLVREVVEHVADRRLDLIRCIAPCRVDLDVELALVRRVRVLAVHGAADLFGDARDAGNRHQPLWRSARRRGWSRAARCRGAGSAWAIR